jgi:hypothetical protein
MGVRRERNNLLYSNSAKLSKQLPTGGRWLAMMALPHATHVSFGPHKNIILIQLNVYAPATNEIKLYCYNISNVDMGLNWNFKCCSMLIVVIPI